MKKPSEIVEDDTRRKSRKTEKFTPWNKGKIVGQKKPFTLKQIQTIKNILAEREDLRDLALFSTGIDTALRESDTLALTVGDVRDIKGVIRTQFTVKQKKTGRAQTVELSRYTREILRRWIAETGKFEDDPVFTGTRKSRNKAISLRHFRLLVKKWAGFAHLDPRDYSTHSLRRTKPAIIYEKTNNPEMSRHILNHSSLQSTSAYLGVARQDAFKVSREIFGE